MKVVHAKDRRGVPPDPAVERILQEVSSENLRAFVETLAFPRHYFAENRANKRARDLIMKYAKDFGYEPSLQGEFENVVMTSPGPADTPALLLGAHYDSVPGTPGADDNASAVAVCLECARLIRRHSIGPGAIVLFNREETVSLAAANLSMAYARRTSAKRTSSRWSAVAIRPSVRRKRHPAYRRFWCPRLVTF